VLLAGATAIAVRRRRLEHLSGLRYLLIGVGATLRRVTLAAVKLVSHGSACRLARAAAAPLAE
jgi:hypothetical protein